MWWLKLIGAYLFGTALEQAATSLQRLRSSASPLQPFTVPPIATGTPIPVLYGTAPVPIIVTWFGGVGSDPVYSYNNPSIVGVVHFAGPQQILVGYSYHVTLQGVLCWGQTSAPINVLFDNRRLLSNEPATQHLSVQGPTTTTTTFVNIPTSDQDWFAIEQFHSGRKTATYCLPSVFGGIGRGGGFGIRLDAFGAPIGGGHVTFAIGSRQYGPDPVMQALINPAGVSDPVNNVPAYGDLTTVVYDQVTVGESTTPPAVSYIIARLVDHPIPGLLNFSYTVGRNIQYGSGPAWGITELNHVAILYDAMRHAKFGAGKPEWLFDAAAWAASALTLFNEGIYGSWLIGSAGQQLALGDIRDEIEQVADGQFVRNPATGLLRFTLNRDEASTPELYAALPAFDERHIRQLDWYEAQPQEVINQVRLEFFNADLLWALDAVTLSNDASIAEIGLKPVTLRFQSITDRAVAIKLCARELRRRSTALARGKIYGTRVFWSAERGNVFKLSDAKAGLSGVVVRIVNIDYGTPESGEIQMDVVEDLFGQDNVVYAGARTPPVITQLSITRPAVTVVSTSLVGASGQLAITVVDPEHRVTEIAFRRQVADGTVTEWAVVASATPNTADPTFPYNATVTLGDLNGTYVATVVLPLVGTSAIEYRVRYVATSATDIQALSGESPPFAAATPVPAPALSYVFSGANVIVTAFAPTATSVKIAASLTGVPDAPTVRATGAHTVAPFTATFVAPIAGQVLYVDALGYEGAAESQLAPPLTIAAGAVSGTTGSVPVTTPDGSGGFELVFDAAGDQVFE